MTHPPLFEADGPHAPHLHVFRSLQHGKGGVIFIALHPYGDDRGRAAQKQQFQDRGHAGRTGGIL